MKKKHKLPKYSPHPKFKDIWCVVGVFDSNGAHYAKIVYEKDHARLGSAHGDHFPDICIRTGWRWWPGNGISWMSFGFLKGERAH